MLPGQPSQWEEQVQTESGAVTVHWFGVTESNRLPRPPVMYLVSFAQSSTTDPKESLEIGKTSLAETLQKQIQARVESVSELGVQGHLGAELRLSQPKGIARARVIVAGDTIYQLVIAGTDNVVNSQDIAGRFFDSFELTAG